MTSGVPRGIPDRNLPDVRFLAGSKAYFPGNEHLLYDMKLAYAREYHRLNPEVVTVSMVNRRARRYGVLSDLTAEEWIAMKKAHDYTCVRCGKREPEIKITMDHIIPMRLGGSNIISNIQPLCRDCNRRKFETEERAKYPKMKPNPNWRRPRGTHGRFIKQAKDG